MSSLKHILADEPAEDAPSQAQPRRPVAATSAQSTPSAPPRPASTSLATPMNQSDMDSRMLDEDEEDDELKHEHEMDDTELDHDQDGEHEHEHEHELDHGNGNENEHDNDNEHDFERADGSGSGTGSRSGAKDSETPLYTSTTQTTRRNANGSVSSVYSGNKIRHLKKDDGIPLWRKDIQYDFLCLVFNNEQRVFTKYSDGSKGHTFAEIYVDAMAKSSKCSKILKEKLAQDFPSAITMAMVCLLVNVGRMNTTLNFFPEMRAQLRTYHSIPALQAHQDPNAYKQLQDAPRLKSILKGATEDTPQPATVSEIRNAQKPRTNPVNLIFVLSQYAPKISEVHFSPPRDFFDLVMRPSLSSKSRATAFLWLIWWYLESDFTAEDALNNPFGAGHVGPGSDGMPTKVPEFEGLTEEQAALENVDSPEEVQYGEIKRKERIAIVASEPSPAMTALKRARKEREERTLFPGALGPEPSDGGAETPSRDFHSPAPYGSAYGANDLEQTRSPSPPPSGFQAINRIHKSSTMGIKSILGEDDVAQSSPVAVPKKGPGRGNWRRNKDKPTEPQLILPNTPAYGFVHESPAVAVSDHRRTRLVQILDAGIRKRQRVAKRKRQEEGGLLRAWKRICTLPSGWDSEDEGLDKPKEDSKDKDKDKDKDEVAKRIKEEDKVAAALRKAANGVPMIGGFALPKTDKEMEREKLHGILELRSDAEDDVGEQAHHFAYAFRRACERLDDWDSIEATGGPLQPPPEFREPELVDDEEEEDEAADVTEVAVPITPRPRQPKKKKGGTAAGGGGRKSKGASTTKASAAASKKGKAAASPAPPRAVDEDETMIGDETGLGGGAELDDEDRELLGELDGDESDEEPEDDGDGDVDGEDEDGMDENK